MIALWLSLAALAQPVEACFGSGLQVSVTSRVGRPVLGLSMVVGGGAGGESPSQGGAAHVLEHLWFRSVRAGRTVDDQLVDMGAEFNAYTTHDATQYLTVLHRRNLRAVLALEAARLADPLAGVTEDVFQAERSVVAQELAERLDGTAGLLNTASRAVVPSDHPYARPISGTPESLAALTLDDLRTYAATWYAPDRSTLVIVSALPHELVLREVAAAFGEDTVAEGPCPRPLLRSEAPEVPASKRAWPVHEAQVAGPVAVVAWSYPDQPGAIDGLAAFLANHKLRHASCSVHPRPRLSVFLCTAPVDRVERAAAAGARVLSRLKQLWASAGDSGRTHHRKWDWLALYAERRGWRTDLLRTQRIDTDPDGALADEARSLHHTGSRRPGRPAALEEGDAAALGAAWLQPSRAGTFVLVPYADTGSVGATAHGARGSDLPDDVVADLDTLRRVVVPPDLGEIAAFDLPNGLAVWAVAAPQAGDDGYARAVFPVDAAWRTDPRLYTIGTEILGVGGKMSPALVLGFKDDGGWVSWDTSPGHWDLSVVSGTPAQGLNVLAGILSGHPLLVPEDELARRLKRTAKAPEVSEDPAIRAARLRWRHLSRGVPHPDLDPPQLHAPVTRAEVDALARRIVHPSNGTVVLVSSVDPALAKAGVEASRLPRWSRPTPPPAPAPRAWRAPGARQVVVVDDPSATAQARITVACHVADVGLPLEMGLLLAEQRLNAELRSTLGATYGVYPLLDRPPHGLTLALSTAVGMPFTGRAVASLLQTLDDLSRGRVAPAELDRLRLSWARKTVTRWQSAPELGDWLAGLAAAGLPPDTDVQLAERLHTLTPAAIGAAFGDCVGHEVVTVQAAAVPATMALDDAGVAHAVR